MTKTLCNNCGRNIQNERKYRIQHDHHTNGTIEYTTVKHYCTECFFDEIVMNSNEKKATCINCGIKQIAEIQKDKQKEMDKNIALVKRNETVKYWICKHCEKIHILDIKQEGVET